MIKVGDVVEVVGKDCLMKGNCHYVTGVYVDSVQVETIGCGRRVYALTDVRLVDAIRQLSWLMNRA